MCVATRCGVLRRNFTCCASTHAQPHSAVLSPTCRSTHRVADASDAGDTSDASNDGSGSDIDFTASEEETAASGMKEGTGPTSTIRKNTGVHNTKNENGETKLQQAVIKGNLQAVRTLLEAGASINCFDNYGWTPLHEACNHGHDDIIQLLLSHPEVRVNDVGQSEVLVESCLRRGACRTVGSEPDESERALYRAIVKLGVMHLVGRICFVCNTGEEDEVDTAARCCR
eukprot:m.984213 g.984213  ORF g.984213 m.984213 type:complete len:228 (-) comp23975_c0_seq27:3592-4275(-)